MKGNVIIVDDEWFIRKGLRKLIEEQTTNWSIVGEAANGAEGWELIERLSPDLAVIDIRMPIMNGIELAERVSRERGNVKLVILTGHKDFAYAQAAVKFGVSDFLLKPCPEEEVVAMLDRMYQQLRTDKGQAERERKLLEEEAIRALLLRLTIREEMLPLIRRQLSGSACWFLSGFAETSAKFGDDMPLLQFAMSNIIEEIADNLGCQVRYVPVQFNLGVLFIGLPGGALSAIQLKQLYAEATGQIRSLLGIGIHITEAGMIDRLERVPELYERIGVTVAGAAASVAARNEERPAALTGAQSLHDSWSYVMASEAPEQLAKLIEEELQAIGKLEARERRSKGMAAGAVLHALERKLERMGMAADAAHPTIERQKGEGERTSEEAAIGPDTLSERLRELEEGDVMSALRKQAETFLSRFARWQEGNNSQAVRKAIQYIETHYKETCSLSEVAAHVHFNPTYLSTLFKRITGERFVNYVTRIRMEQARLLLHNTDMKIAEIAQTVGYDDPNYFTTAFSRMHGMSPNQYRKQHASPQV